MDNEVKVRFGIDAIRDEKCEFSGSIPENIDADKLELRYLVETEIMKSSGKVGVRTGVIYSFEEKTLCELVLFTSFYLSPFSDIISIDESKKKVSFTVEVIPTLLNISFGIMRGVLYEKTKGTSLAAFPLPLISMPVLVDMNHFRVERAEG